MRKTTTLILAARGEGKEPSALHLTSHVGGFDFPPLNAALAAPEMSHMVLDGSRAFFPTSAGYVGPPGDFGSSYMRSGSDFICRMAYLI